jgi:hypothetical protein
MDAIERHDEVHRVRSCAALIWINGARRDVHQRATTSRPFRDRSPTTFAAATPKVLLHRREDPMSTIVTEFEPALSLQLVSAVPARPQPRPRPARPFLWIDGARRPTEILHAFERSGGVWTGVEVERMLHRRTAQPISLLARWIVDSLVISLPWRGDYLLPAFQFDVANATVRRPVFEVLEALGGSLKDLELAAWFALPNESLHGVAPVDMIDDDPAAVLDAAHVERRAACS